MADALVVPGGLTIPRAELMWRFSHSGGPGGQGVNTADSRVELRWDVVNTTVLSPTQRRQVIDRLGHRMFHGALVVVACEHRTQLNNRRAAQTRLVTWLTEALAPAPSPRRPTRPSRGRIEARLNSKRHKALTKQLRRPVSDS